MLRRIARVWLLPAAFLLAATTQPSSASEIVSGYEVIRDPQSGRVQWLLDSAVSREPAPGASLKTPQRWLEAAEAQTYLPTAQAALAGVGAAFGVKDPAKELDFGVAKRDPMGNTHLVFQQHYQGLPVEPSELRVHLNALGETYAISGAFANGLPADTQPTLAEHVAAELAEFHVGLEFPIDARLEAVSSRLLILALGLIDNKPADDARLAWEITVEDESGSALSARCYLDAQDGHLLRVEDNSKRAFTPRIYDCSIIDQAGNWGCPSEATYPAYPGYTFGRRMGAPARGPSPVPQFLGSMDVDSLYEHMLPACYNYYLDTFGRDGANYVGGIGDGTFNWIGRTAAFANVDNVWPEGCPNSARWVGNWGELHFCEGTTKFDVVAHEYTHAVLFTEFENTNYSGQPGTIEEHLADVLGVAIESLSLGYTDWIVGNQFAWKRDAARPESVYYYWMNSSAPSRSNSLEYFCGSSDNGGVHHNCSVLSKACYLMSEGGLFNGCEIPATGFEAVQRILYHFICNYMSSNTMFSSAYVGYQQACTDLYGSTHPEYLASVVAALQAVELDQPGRCSGIPEVAPACAVIGGGAAYSGLATGDEDSLFTTNESVWLHSQDGVPGRRVLVHRLVPGTEPGLWEAIPSGADTLSVMVGLDGVLAASLGSLPAGTWTLLLDGDRDGFWQPWADQQLAVTITPAPPRVTGLTARVEPSESQPARIRLDWNPLPDAPAQTQYQVEGDTLPQFPLPHLLTTTQDTTWTDSLSVTPPPLRLYRVKAVTP
jgi:hypothetical protein